VIVAQAAPLDELAAVSARVGSDPLLVQGPGGNTSVKTGDEIWVKASGVWLAEAERSNIFVGLSLSGARDLAARSESEDLSAACLPENEPGLRPSIEALLHVSLPHFAVLHAHAVGSMTLSVLADGRERARTAFAGLDWAWVPYHRPGAPLAAATVEAVAGRKADVLILQNHGVVTGGRTPREAEALLREVERRLEWPTRASSESVGSASTERYETLSELGSLALDSSMFELVTRAALFPDQVVFLGGAVPFTGPGESIEAAADRSEARSGVLPALVLAPGVGAFGLIDRTATADAVIRGLFEVARRVPVEAEATSLSDEAVAELLGWEAEAHRVKLARQQGK
jgi:rhamnose utilization protein RhaD (predicted bifunctional aldolase and dehydrogenase)